MATIKIKIYVSELASVMALYDKIWVQRTVTAPPSTSDEDLTTSVAQPARLTGTVEGPYLLTGKTLTFKVNGTQISVVFAYADPLAITQVVEIVNNTLVAAGLRVVASAFNGTLRISTQDAGTQFTLEMISGSAITILGFAVGQKAHGTAAYIGLVVGTTQYEFEDGAGLASYYYRSRFYNSSNGTYSAWSDWIQGTTGAAVDPAQLIVAKVKLAGLDGAALSGTKITIANTFQPNKADGYGIFGGTLVLETDGAGQAETVLVKGSMVDVIFSGTSIARRIRVPASGSEFDLLDDSLVVGDEFEIQVPDIPYAPRRS
jgi:hypothetical protein